MSEQMTMSEFVKRYGVSISAEYTDNNPNMNHPSDKKWIANHYWVTLKRRENGKRRQMSLYYSQGLGIKDEPRVGDVLNCLAQDSAGIEESFEDWAENLGYDPDSRRAEHTYKVCVRQAAKLKQFLGEDGYETLLYKVEPL